jgi:hypothetical protein
MFSSKIKEEMKEEKYEKDFHCCAADDSCEWGQFSSLINCREEWYTGLLVS